MLHMYIHPAWQAAFSVLLFYVLWLGWARTRSLHLGHAAKFNRRRHTLLGQVALYGLLLGFCGGAVAARGYWYGWFSTDIHARVGLVMAALMLWGLASGLYLLRRPAPRKLLPALHGAGNLLVALLAVAQYFSGDALLDQIMPGL